MNKLISIVIVNYNGAKYQNNCIQSILNNSYQNFKIIVVDNHSTDDSINMLKEFKDDRLILILEKENHGIAKGNNIGIKKSLELKSDYTLLLNNDTILEKNLLQTLLQEIENERVCVPKIYLEDGETIWYGGGGFKKWRGNAKHFNYLQKEKSIKYQKYYDYSPTTCMLIDNCVFKDVGLMDEKYFLYFDDTDFCFRLKQNNIRIKFTYNTFIKHLVGQSSGGEKSELSIYYMSRNKLYFVHKYSSYFNSLIRFLVLYAKKMDALFGYLKRDNRRIIKKAIQDFQAGKMGKCDKF